MDGQQHIAAMMETYRNNPPKSINGSNIIKLLDYELQVEKNMVTGDEIKIDMPKSNVLQFILADGSSISARPSGTEPKIKFYFSVNAELKSAGDYEKMNGELEEKIKAIISDMNL